jgi:hypothetical protein
MIHSVTFYRVYEKHSPGHAKKAGSESAAIFPTELPRKVYPGLQEVHRWRDEDGGCAHAPKEGQQQPHQVHSIMILPQVHLRKPCYDFYFL